MERTADTDRGRNDFLSSISIEIVDGDGGGAVSNGPNRGVLKTIGGERFEGVGYCLENDGRLG